MQMQLDKTTLIVKIKNTEPVELADFAKSMMSLANDYQSRQTADPRLPAKLYIKEIKSGSIIAELAPMLPLAGQLLIEHYDQIENYAEHLYNLIGWLLGKNGKPENTDGKQLNNHSNIVNPVANDKGGQLTFSTVNHSGSVVNNITVNYYEANTVQNRARQEIRQLQEQEEPVENGDYTQVLMYWAQAAPDKETDQAVIEAVWPKPVKVILPDRIKQEILLDEPYPFKKLQQLTGAGRLLFPNSRRPDDMISATTLNRALEYLGIGFTAHDFRATLSTHLNELGYDERHIEMQLAHAETNNTQAAYNHAQFLEPRRKMMQDWADFVDSANT